jgi:hypothetical protein
MMTEDHFESLLSRACQWAEDQERIIMREGGSLTVDQVRDAATVGVIDTNKIRLQKVDHIPSPEDPLLRDYAESTQLISPYTGGLTLRYGIYVRADMWHDRKLIFHEFVHVFQYERFGGFRPFLRQYLYECIKMGYPAAPLEQEAIITATRLCTQRTPG